MNSVHTAFAESHRVAQEPPRPPVRATYRHGDLRRALLDAGIELARAGGPEAIVLREVTRRAGVTSNAAYRHFAGRLDLLQVVRAASLTALACIMETELGSIDPTWPADAQARASPRAIGVGYLRFVQMETGLFRIAFAVSDEVENDADPAKAGNSGRNPFQLLGLTLDRMTVAGVLPAEHHPGAKYPVQSAVYGFALLIIDGPLRSRPPEQTGAIALCVAEMVENGL